MGLVYKLFGFNSSPFHITSYLFRLLASFSLYPIALELTKKRLSASVAVLFFSVTAVGLETTGWVFNMSSYIAIIFLNIFFYFYMKSRRNLKPLPLILTGGFFAAAFLMLPIRMHGLIVFVLAMELFWLFQKTITFKQFLIRSALFIVIFLIIILRLAQSPIAPAFSVSEEIISNFTKLIAEGNFSFLLNPVKTIGSIFIPLLKNYSQQFIAGSLALAAWILFIFKSKQLSEQNALIFPLFWLISSFIFAWLRFPGGDPLNWPHRYLIVSGLGIALFLAAITSIPKIKNITYFLAAFLIFINIISARSYLQDQEKTHNITISSKIWNAVPKIDGIGQDNKPFIFYFEGEGSNSGIIRDVITFGFPPHMALIYNLQSKYNSYGHEKLPLPMNEWSAVVNAARNGKGLYAYGYPEEKVSLDRIYAFHLQGSDNLINITDQARLKLRELLSGNN